MSRTESRPAPLLPPVTLAPEEAAAIAVALAARPGGPYADAGRTALEKVLGALEPDPVRRARLVASSLWAGAEAGQAADDLAVLEQAVHGRRVVALRYRDGKGEVSRREVEPQLLVRSSDHVFLVAWCRERSALRWFRADRIESVELTGETAPRRDLAGLGAPPVTGHPAGRALRRGAPGGRPAANPAPARPQLVVLPGGRI
jgi:predicted DNA-binding transcriptional regulator YafY